MANEYDDAFMSALVAAAHAKTGARRSCTDPFNCGMEFLAGAGSTVVSVATNPMTIACVAAGVGTVASAGTLVAAGAALCLGAATINLGSQAVDYGVDLAKHGGNPLDTAADAWAPYAYMINSGDYYDLGAASASTAITWGGDALLIYGGYSAIKAYGAGGVPVAEPSQAPVVIGEDMAGRVEPYARRIGGETYQPDPDLPMSDWENAQRAWILRQIADGREIHDVGPAPGRPMYPGISSPWYFIEQYELMRANYPVTVVGENR
jgi:hypothetical protein